LRLAGKYPPRQRVALLELSDDLGSASRPVRDAIAGGLDSFTPWINERATDFLWSGVAVKGGIAAMMGQVVH
jgi:hypothetical protein